MVDVDYIRRFEHRIGCSKPKYEIIPHCVNGNAGFGRRNSCIIARNGYFTDRIMIKVEFDGCINHWRREDLHKMFKSICLEIGGHLIMRSTPRERELEDTLFPGIVRRISTLGKKSYLLYEFFYKKDDMYLVLPDLLEVRIMFEFISENLFNEIFNANVEVLSSSIMVEYLIHPIPDTLHHVNSIEQNMKTINLYNWSCVVSDVKSRYNTIVENESKHLEYIFFRFFRNYTSNIIDIDTTDILVQIDGFDRFCPDNALDYKYTLKEHFDVVDDKGWYCIPLVHRKKEISLPQKSNHNWKLRFCVPEIEPCEVQVYVLCYDTVLVNIA